MMKNINKFNVLEGGLQFHFAEGLSLRGQVILEGGGHDPFQYHGFIIVNSRLKQNGQK